MSDETSLACRFGIWGAAGTVVGIVLSGPLAVVFVNATHPQPPWDGPRVFAAHTHPVQTLPYIGGIVLVMALVTLVASIHALAEPRQRVVSTIAVVLCSVFATLIFLNYVIQTTYVPEMARDYRDSNAALLEALAMTNPKSLSWAIEMWGWGFLGVSTLLLGPVFQGSRLERATKVAFMMNGPVSIAGAVWTVLEPGWAMTAAGLVAFSSWNVLLLAMAVLALASFRRRLIAAASPSA